MKYLYLLLLVCLPAFADITGLVTPPGGSGVQFPSSIALSASGDTTGAADSASIQSALNVGGRISLTSCAVYWINATLIYSSNTELNLPACATVRQVAGTSKTMLNSSSAVAYAAGGTTVTLTQGSGNAVTVAWTAHGLSVGSYLWLSGASPSTYNGVYRVDAVTDANDVVIHTWRTAISAASGTITAVQAVYNFTLDGDGTWDYNKAASNTGTATNAHIINLQGVADSSVRDVVAINGQKYALNLCAVHGVRVQNFHTVNGSDGIKIYGPAMSVLVDGLYGVTQDDSISVQPLEASGFSSYQLTYPGGGGDAVDVHIEHVAAADTGSASVVAVYPSDSQYVDRLTIEDITGTATGRAAVYFVAGSGYTTGAIGSVVLRNVSGIGSTDAISFGSSIVTIGNVRIENSRYLPWNAAYTGQSGSFNAYIDVLSAAVINKMTVTGVYSDWNGATSSASLINLLGTVKDLSVNDSSFDITSGNNLDVVHYGATATSSTISFANDYVGPNVKYLVKAFPTNSTTPTFVFRNVTTSGTSGAGVLDITTTLTATAIFSNNNFSNLGLGVVRLETNSPVLTARSDGTNVYAGTFYAHPSGTPTIVLKGNDISADVTDTTVSTSVFPQWAQSTTTGTGKQGMAVKVNGNSTSTWYALATGTAGVNTLIN